MYIGERLRTLRKEKKLSQAEIKKRTGLLPSYLSRVENGHTVPSVETLEKWAHALEMPLYQLFYEGDEPPQLPRLLKDQAADAHASASSRKAARFVQRLRPLLARMSTTDRQLLLHIVQKMARR